MWGEAQAFVWFLQICFKLGIFQSFQQLRYLFLFAKPKSGRTKIHSSLFFVSCMKHVIWTLNSVQPATDITNTLRVQLSDDYISEFLLVFYHFHTFSHVVDQIQTNMSSKTEVLKKYSHACPPPPIWMSFSKCNPHSFCPPHLTASIHITELKTLSSPFLPALCIQPVWSDRAPTIVPSVMLFLPTNTDLQGPQA